MERMVIRDRISSILGRSDDKYVKPADLKEIGSVGEAQTRWTIIKRAGDGYLTGEAYAAFGEIQKLMEEHGIFILKIGELERFHKDISQTNKAEWLRLVLEQKLFQYSQAVPIFHSVSHYLSAGLHGDET